MLYATLGAFPSRPSDFTFVLIIISFAVRLLFSSAALASLAVKLFLSFAPLATSAVRLFLFLADSTRHGVGLTTRGSRCNTISPQEDRQNPPLPTKEGSAMFRRTLALLVTTLMAAWGAPAWSQVKEIPWGTAAVGSSGHRALVTLAEVLNREMPDYRITVQPATGAIITMKGYATGKFEGYYGADIGFYEYAKDINRFKGFKASAKRPLGQSLWTYTIEVGTAVHSRDKGKFKGWSDLNGKAIFTGLLPWDVRAHLERAYGALGVRHNYRQVDLSAAGSLLQSGALEGFIIYTAGETAPASWITEASLAADWAALNPSASEIEGLKQLR